MAGFEVFSQYPWLADEATRRERSRRLVEVEEQFKEGLKRARLARGLSHEEVAKLLECGPAEVAKAEHPDGDAHLSFYVRLAHVLGVELSLEVK